MKCSIKVCEQTATAAVAISVPATGYEATPENSVKIVLGILLCPHCMGTIKAQEFFGADGRLKSIIELQTKGRVAPDYDRAFITPVALDSDEYKILARAKR